MLYHTLVRNMKFTGQTMSILPLGKNGFAASALALSVSRAKCEGSKAMATLIRPPDESSSTTHAIFHLQRSKARIR